MIIVAVIGLLGNLFSRAGSSEELKGQISILSRLICISSATRSRQLPSSFQASLSVLQTPLGLTPVFTILINIVILRSALLVLRESVGILMQSAPVSVDIDHVVKKLKEIDGIAGVHHIHVWRLDENNTIP